MFPFSFSSSFSVVEHVNLCESSLHATREKRLRLIFSDINIDEVTTKCCSFLVVLLLILVLFNDGGRGGGGSDGGGRVWIDEGEIVVRAVIILVSVPATEKDIFGFNIFSIESVCVSVLVVRYILLLVFFLLYFRFVHSNYLWIYRTERRKEKKRVLWPYPCDGMHIEYPLISFLSKSFFVLVCFVVADWIKRQNICAHFMCISVYRVYYWTQKKPSKEEEE